MASRARVRRLELSLAALSGSSSGASDHTILTLLDTVTPSKCMVQTPGTLPPFRASANSDLSASANTVAPVTFVPLPTKSA